MCSWHTVCGRLLSLFGYLDFTGMWSSDDQRRNIIKTHVLKDIGLCIQFYLKFYFLKNQLFHIELQPQLGGPMYSCTSIN